MYTVKIATFKEFAESKDAWNALAAAMPLPSIFCTWEWIYTWWEHFGVNYKPLILYVVKDSELKGILPLASHKTMFHQEWLTGNVLTFCGSRELYPDHLDLITASEDADGCVRAVFDFLSSRYKEWDVLWLSHVREENYFETQLKDSDCRFASKIKPASVAPYISLSGNFEEFKKTLSSQLRKNVKKRRRKLYEDWNFTYGACDMLGIDEGLRVLFDLHARRAKRKKIRSAFNNENIFNFHRALMRRAIKNDWVWIRNIRDEQRVIAASYLFVFGNRISAYQKGIDPEWEQYGTGTLINYETIQEAFGKGFEEFDFLRGNEEHKANWTQKKRLLFDIHVYNRTVKAGLAKTFFQARSVLAKLVKRKVAEGNAVE